MATETCQGCGGEGFECVGYMYHRDEPPTPYGPKCEVCGGEGVVEMDEPEPYFWDWDDYEPADSEESVESESDYDDPMDGDAESALASAGFGTDEDYGLSSYSED